MIAIMGARQKLNDLMVGWTGEGIDFQEKHYLTLSALRSYIESSDTDYPEKDAGCFCVRVSLMLTRESLSLERRSNKGEWDPVAPSLLLYPINEAFLGKDMRLVFPSNWKSNTFENTIDGI